MLKLTTTRSIVPGIRLRLRGRGTRGRLFNEVQPMLLTVIPPGGVGSSPTRTSIRWFGSSEVERRYKGKAVRMLERSDPNEAI